NILLCLDGGVSDSRIINMGLELCKKLGAKAHGLTVQDILTLEGPLMYDISGALAFIPQMNFLEETRKTLEERSRNILTGLRKAFEEEELPFEEEIAEGIVYKVICEKGEMSDLTLIGRQGLHYQFDKEFLGSTADRVIRHTRGPVLVVTHDIEPLKNPILAYDGSHPAKKAMATAAQLCSDLQLPLTVLNVSSDEKKSKEILEEAKEYLEAYDLVLKYDYSQGRPHEEVAQYTKRHKHDLLFLGAQGHRGILDFILGSTTQYALWAGGFHVLVDR
ncbi:MAG: universal stress protein, partial [bacterium]|nr:universal stress protein [bacterium]